MPVLESPAESFLATRALRAGSRESAHLPTDEPEKQPVFEPDLASALPTVCKADIVGDDLTGLCLGQYALGTKIGGGGMGKVFRARHIHLDRIFAIKFMASELSGDSEAQNRFEQETLALGKLQHPQIVNAVDAGCLNGLMYLVTEFIEGEDLAQLVQRRGVIPPGEACDLIRQVAIGLAYSHSCGFVHRDIKPSNLIVDKAGIVKILDFGLVSNAHRDHRLTGNGELLGTWDFIAPEQAQDASQIDFRCDIYSLGCTLLYLLSGNAPFGDAKYATPAAKLKGHLFDKPTWLQNPPANIPRGLAIVLNRMLAKSPSQRFKSASDVAEALARFTNQSRENRLDSNASEERERSTSVGTILVCGTFAFCLISVFAWLAYSFLQLNLGATNRNERVADASIQQPSAPVKPPTAPIDSALPQKTETPVAPQKIAKVTEEPLQITSFNQSLNPHQTPNRTTVEQKPLTDGAPVIEPFPPGRPARKYRRVWGF